MQPQDFRVLGKVTGGADNVQIRVRATGEVYITTDPALPLNIADLVAGNPGNGDSVLAYGSDDGGVTPRAIKTESGGRLEVVIYDTPTGAVLVFAAGEQTAIAAAATATVVSYVPAIGDTLTLERIIVQGNGSFKWRVVYSADGVAETAILARGYTSPSTPQTPIEIGRRYTLLGDATKAIQVKATNIDITLQADASAEIVGFTD